MKNNPQILIVDDDLHIIKIIRRLLSKYKLNIYSTSSPIEAMEIIKVNNIDLIISDQRMPEMDGILLLSMVKEISPDTIRILMSGYTDVNILVEAINSGSIYQYIQKPWENDIFIRTIFKALEVQIEDLEHKIFKDLLKNRKWIDSFSQTKQIQRSDFLNKIIKDQMIITDKVKEEAELLNIETTASYYICLISVKDNIPDAEVNHKSPTQPKFSELNFVINMLPDCIAWTSGEYICVIVISDPSVVKKSIKGMIKNLRELVIDYYSDNFLMGISNIHVGLEELGTSFNQAHNAYIVARSSHIDACITYYEEIGILQLLTKLRGLTETSEYVEKTLGELIQYDKEKGSELLHTLEVLLVCNNLKEAAEKLFIHPKTMIFRKKRIETILFISLDDYEIRLSLGIALKLYNLS
jgi:sugar diacid utilization regulator/CheY-like chemotaxis protein